MKRILLVLLLSGCAYNPYTQPHFDWQGAPSLLPLDYRAPAPISNMCLGRYA